MMKEFWKNIALEMENTQERKDKRNEKKNGKSPTKEKKRSKRKRKEHEISQCVDPFHFIQKCDNLSKERPTKCSCSRFKSPKTHTKSKNIKSFLTTIPTLCPMSTNDMDFILQKQKLKHNRDNNFSTKESKIRDQHDRGKKRKQVKIDKFFF